jgi:hypothetical protein
MYHKWSSEHLFLVNITKSVNFSKTPIALKEHLVYSDMDGSLFHFIIENSTFVDASKIPPEVRMKNSIRSYRLN